MAPVQCKMGMLVCAIGMTVGGIAVGAQANRPVTLFANQRPSTYLDLTEAAARRLKIAGPIADFSRCFRAMTGRDLPRAGGSPTGLIQPSPKRLASSVVLSVSETPPRTPDRTHRWGWY
jgi:hypothetical protein